ncbi:MAG TPA: GAF domain-containing protein [Thermoplasmata archaeon]|nr:GAF domain-containing protein [Thermoplasmata archaeon]
MTVPSRAVAPSLLQIDAILGRLAGRAALAETCRFLRATFPHYRWVGVYRVDGSDLVLEAWEGPAATEHTRIPIARGICGQAAREDRTVIVDDVTRSPEYLACFAETRSEIVVPIRDGPAVVGEIDIDGDRVAAYDASDRQFLERIAPKLTPALTRAAAEPPPDS